MLPNCVLLDNDIILKTVAYGRAEGLIAAASLNEEPPAALGVSRFVVAKRVSRTTDLRLQAAMRLQLYYLEQVLNYIEPDIEEIEFAAQLENLSLESGFDLDVGESQLIALLLKRQYELLITGDKRAIVAIERKVMPVPEEKVACFEQLMSQLIIDGNPKQIRDAVCAAPNVDTAVTICCACHSNEVSTQDILDGLQSYSSDVRRSAPTALLSGSDLNALHARRLHMAPEVPPPD